MDKKIQVDCNEVVVFDTETTGFNFNKDSPDGYGPDRICSLGAIHLKRDESGTWAPVSRKVSKFNPGRPLMPDASKVNGFYWSNIENSCPEGLTDLSKLPEFRISGKAILAYIGDKPIVAHNAQFDLAFIDSELERAGLPLLSGTYICTRQCMADMTGQGRYNKYASQTRLDNLCDYLEIKKETRLLGHGALVDAQLCAEAFATMDSLGFALEEKIEILEHRISTRMLNTPNL